MADPPHYGAIRASGCQMRVIRSKPSGSRACSETIRDRAVVVDEDVHRAA